MKYTFLLIILFICILLYFIYTKKERFQTSTTFEIDSRPKPIPSDATFQQLVKDYFNQNEQARIIKEYGYISTWDTSQVTDMSNAFNDLTSFTGVDDGNVETSQNINTKLVKYKDSQGNEKQYTAWDTKNVLTMESMFSGATNFNGNVSNWDTSSVINMSYMFHYCKVFSPTSDKNINTKVVDDIRINANGDFETYTAWDTCLVGDMSAMFWNAYKFNGDISKWDTSSVRNMSSMFRGGISNNTIFNQDISNWNVINVLNFFLMFSHNSAFDKDIRKWPVNYESDVNLNYMFSGATNLLDKYNAPSEFISYSHSGTWGENYKPTNNFFNYIEGIDDYDWVTNTRIDEGKPNSIKQDYFFTILNLYLFSTNRKNKIIEVYGHIKEWDTSELTSLKGAFKLLHKDSFNGKENQDINTKQVTVNGVTYTAWDTSNVTDMSHMFYNRYQLLDNFDEHTVIPSKFEGNISNWDTSNVTTMKGMFYFAEKFNQDINTKVVEGVKVNQEGEKVPYTAWDTKNVTNMSKMFYLAKNFNQDISKWDTSNVTNMSYMFLGAKDFNPLNEKNINTKNVKISISDGSIYEYIAWNTKNVTDMSVMFGHATSFNCNISKWNTSKVIYMRGMFGFAELFNKDINTKNVTLNDKTYTAWDTKNVTDMLSMFYNAENFNGNISSWNTSKVTYMHGMFYNATSFNSDISKWDTSEVTNMNSMFYYAKEFNGDISNWDTSSVTNMNYMFSNATSFNSNISSWNTSNVINMNSMFYNATKFDSDISKWDVSNVTDMGQMFYDAKKFRIKFKIDTDLEGCSNINLDSDVIPFNCIVRSFDEFKSINNNQSTKFKDYIQTLIDQNLVKKGLPETELLKDTKELNNITLQTELKDTVNDYYDEGKKLTFEFQNNFSKQLQKKLQEKINNYEQNVLNSKEKLKEKINIVKNKINFLQEEKTRLNYNSVKTGSIKNLYNNVRINFEYKNDNYKLLVTDGDNNSGYLSYNNLTHKIGNIVPMNSDVESTPERNVNFIISRVDNKDQYNRFLVRLDPTFKKYVTSLDQINYPFYLVEPVGDRGYCLTFNKENNIYFTLCSKLKAQRFALLNYTENNCNDK